MPKHKQGLLNCTMDKQAAHSYTQIMALQVRSLSFILTPCHFPRWNMYALPLRERAKPCRVSRSGPYLIPTDPLDSWPCASTYACMCHKTGCCPCPFERTSRACKSLSRLQWGRFGVESCKQHISATILVRIAEYFTFGCLIMAALLYRIVACR